MHPLFSNATLISGLDRHRRSPRKYLAARLARPSRASGQPGHRKVAHSQAWRRTLLLITLLVTPVHQALSQTMKIEGFWATSNLSSVVEIRQCDDALCAQIRWLWAVSVEGRKLTDQKNPSESRQTKPLIGLPLFYDVKLDGKQWKGRIYNPEDGRRYRATLRQSSPNVLRLRGCWGPFCKSQRWRRLGSIAFPSEASLSDR